MRIPKIDISKVDLQKTTWIGLTGACGIMEVKNVVTYKQRKAIIEAISAYNQAQIREYEKKVLLNIISGEENPELDYIDYSVVEGYWKSLFKVWYWGKKKLVPDDVYEKIKPYLEKHKKTEKTLDETTEASDTIKTPADEEKEE